jgi:hypothetical protein
MDNSMARPSDRAGGAIAPEPDKQSRPEALIPRAGSLWGSFNAFCAWGECTPTERRQLAIHLAGYRGIM